MTDILEHDVIKGIKFCLILLALLYALFIINASIFACGFFIGVHVIVFAVDLVHRIRKGKWRYSPY